MKLLKTIKESDIFPGSNLNINIDKYRERSAARAVVFDQEGNIALLHVSKDHYYKLPGGGIEEGEDNVEALKRECIEEIGCNIQVKDEVGEIIEYRGQGPFGDGNPLKQISYCYIASLVGTKGEPKLEQGEIDDGFKTIWLDLDKAIELLKQVKTDAYNGKHIVMRDLAFLEEVKSMV